MLATNVGAVTPLLYAHTEPPRLATPAPAPTDKDHRPPTGVSRATSRASASTSTADSSLVPKESVTATALGAKVTFAATPSRWVAMKSPDAPTKIAPSWRFSIELLAELSLISAPLGR